MRENMETSDIRDGVCELTLQASEALQLFAGLEAHGFARRNVHFFAGARIAANAGFSRLYREDSEPAQFNPLAAAHSILQRFKNRFDGLFGLHAAHACPFELRQYGVHDIQFNQALPPPLRASEPAPAQAIGVSPRALAYHRGQMLEAAREVVKT